MNQIFRTGFGFDVHAFERGRKLIIGGVEIPYELGLQGHSDADVLLHSISDALLGALALGDIGTHFPDSEDRYKDIDSKLLLKQVYRLLLDKSFSLGNVDSVIVMQKPKIASYIPQMREVIAKLLEVNVDQISIKATTTEMLGFVGRSEGAAAYSTVLIIGKNPHA